MGFVAELKRRNVIRMAGLYLVGAWLVVQVASTLLPMFSAPTWAPRAVVIALAALFLPVLLLSWVYEFTPEGLKRESEIDRSASITHTTGQRIEHVIVVLLALGIAYFAFDKFVLAPRQQAVEVAQARKEAGAQALVNAYGDKSIAVLPFVNMSADKEQEYFADGIAEELLNRLAKVEGLRVIARTSSFSFKGSGADVATIARALGVSNLLEGSVRRSGNKLRISAKLVRAADGNEVWSETYDRELSDVFAMQDEIAASVVSGLKLQLMGSGEMAPGTNPEAYALYLQGRQLRYVRSAPALEQSFALLQRAVELDPRLAEAWAELSMVYRTQADAGSSSNAEGYALARQAANKALALKPGLAVAHVYLAYVERGALNPAPVAAQLSLAARSEPENIELLRAASLLANSLGRFDQAIAYAQAVVARDPQNAGGYVMLGSAYRFAGRPDDGLASYQQAEKLSPRYVTLHDSMSDVLRAKGRFEEALAEAKKEEHPVWGQTALAKAYYALGRKAESDAALAVVERDDPVGAAFNIAYVYAVRGEKDLAFQWLERAVEVRDPGISDVATHISLRNLHDDPRWLPFLRKHGFAPEQLAAIKLDVPVPSLRTDTPR
jgi:TolB-like protein/Flp pilus assembly protein TadD